MTDSKTIADIAEEWEFLKNKSSQVHAISVHGGWLSAALPVLFEAIELLKAEKVELIEERGVLKKEWADRELELLRELEELVEQREVLKTDLKDLQDAKAKA